MATTDQTALLRMPARMAIGLTGGNNNAPSGSFPHGGTYLGLIKKIAIVVKKPVTEIMEEGLGCKIPLAVLNMGEVWGVRAVVRAPDQGVLQNFFGQSENTGPSGQTRIVYPGFPSSNQFLPGQFVNGVRFLLEPYDPAQWVLYFPNCVLVANDPEIDAAMDRETEIQVSFKAMPPVAGGRGETAQWGPLSDVAL